MDRPRRRRSRRASPARDDLRTSLGQAHVVRRVARLASVVHATLDAVLTSRAGSPAAPAGCCTALLAADRASSGSPSSVRRSLSIAAARHALPGHLDVRRPDRRWWPTTCPTCRRASERSCGCADARRPAPSRGRPAAARRAARPGVPRPRASPTPRARSPCSDVDLHVPAGQTVALVGRTGSGKSTLAALLSRAIEPPRGHGLPRRHRRPGPRPPAAARVRSAWSRSAPRSSPARLAENITLFAELPRSHGRGRGGRAGPGPTGSPACPTAWTPCSAPAARRSRPARSSWSRSPACWSATCSVVVLDEATARMDPLTERRVVRGRRPAARRPAPASSSPTGSPRSSAPRWSPCSSGAASSSRAPAPSSRRSPGRSATCWRPAAPSTARPARRGRHRRQGRRRGRALRGGPHRRRGTPSLRPAAGDRGRRHRSLPGARHRARTRRAAARGACWARLCSCSPPSPARKGAVTGLLWGRVVEDLQRRREPHVADRRGRGEPAGRAGPAGQRLLALSRTGGSR